jgi:putative SOS response-associated peptidase YedK
MCGRYASARKRQELLDEFLIERDQVADDLEPDYNVAPTKPVYAVLTRGLRRSAAAAAAQASAGQDGQAGGPAAATGKPVKDIARELRVVRWGLVPSWAKDPAVGSRMINARAETVDAKPSFRSAFAKRRCLLPADGFYEWLKVTEDDKTRKQPYYIHRSDGGPLAFAGLYELWRDKSVPDEDPHAWLWTAVIITTEAQDEVGRIHDRMPMVIAPGSWADWLDPGLTEPAQVHPLLAPASVSGLASYPVGPEVNNVRNNGPGLLEPQDRDKPARTRGRHKPADSAPPSLF